MRGKVSEALPPGPSGMSREVVYTSTASSRSCFQNCDGALTMLFEMWSTRRVTELARCWAQSILPSLLKARAAALHRWPAAIALCLPLAKSADERRRRRRALLSRIAASPGIATVRLPGGGLGPRGGRRGRSCSLVRAARRALSFSTMSPVEAPSSKSAVSSTIGFRAVNTSLQPRRSE